MDPQVIGAPPRPQAIFVGFSSEDPEFKAMARLVGRALIVPQGDELEWFTSNRVLDWDVVVTRAIGDGGDWIPINMFVFAMNGAGAGSVARYEVPASAPNTTHSLAARAFVPKGRQPSPRINVHELTSPALSRLVKNELVPWLQEQELVPFLESYSADADKSLRGDNYVTDADGHSVAGHFQRGFVGSNKYLTQRVLVVPHMPPAPELWLGPILEEWRTLSPGQFCDLPTWRSDPSFKTAEERVALDALQRLDDAHDEALASYQRQRLALEADLVNAEAAAANGLLRLLTEQGQPLSEAVIDGLRRLGFGVIDADSLRPTGEAKMEDLQITDASVEGWSCIAEVKGYSGGAKTRDFQSIARYAAAYLKRKQRPPSARWYVVNQFMTEPPSTRPEPFRGAAEDVAMFAEDDGLVIDTRSLFDLVRRVSEGELTADAARETLRTARGIYDQ